MSHQTLLVFWNVSRGATERIFINNYCTLSLTLHNLLGSRSPAVVVDTGRRGVVGEAIIVEVNLSATLLQNRHNIVE
jgi:hypothetical protein